jgi:hypothetical protein
VVGLEQGAELPSGDEERFAGYGVMGVPFTSGDLLATRRFPASSLGQGYTSVWHRDPQARWTFYSDVAPQLPCPRYFGSAVGQTVVREIEITTPYRTAVARWQGFGCYEAKKKIYRSLQLL